MSDTHAKSGLEMLVRVRQYAEQEQQQRVAAIESKDISLRDSLRRANDRIVMRKTILRNNLTGRLDATSLRSHAGTTLQAMREGNRVMLELLGIHRQLDQVQKTLSEAVKKRQIVEALHQKRVARLQHRSKCAETSAGDELSMNSTWRNGQDQFRNDKK